MMTRRATFVLSLLLAVARFAEQFFVIDNISAEDVRALAARVFDLDQRIELRQVPRL